MSTTLFWIFEGKLWKTGTVYHLTIVVYDVERKYLERNWTLKNFILHEFHTVKFKFIPFFCFEWHLDCYSLLICVLCTVCKVYLCDISSLITDAMCYVIHLWCLVELTLCDLRYGHCWTLQLMTSSFTHTMKFRWENR